MKLAVPIDPNTEMVAPHFWEAPHLKIYTEDMGVVFTDVVDSPANGHDGVCAFLSELGVQILLCSDMTEEARDALFEHGIAVMAGLGGPADEIVIAMLEGRLRYVSSDTDAQPQGGCSCACDCSGGDCGTEGCGCGCGC